MEDGRVWTIDKKFVKVAIKWLLDFENIRRNKMADIEAVHDEVKTAELVPICRVVKGERFVPHAGCFPEGVTQTQDSPTNYRYEDKRGLTYVIAPGDWVVDGVVMSHEKVKGEYEMLVEGEEEEAPPVEVNATPTAEEGGDTGVAPPILNQEVTPMEPEEEEEDLFSPPTAA